MKRLLRAVFCVEPDDAPELTAEQVRDLALALNACRRENPALAFVRRFEVHAHRESPEVLMTFNVKEAVGEAEWAAHRQECREAREPMDPFMLADAWLGAGGAHGAEDLIETTLRTLGVEASVTYHDLVSEVAP